MESNWKGFSFYGTAIHWKVIELKLKRNFNTAHSSSSIRRNVVIKFAAPYAQGYGECGLPPKKAHCYLADVEYCFEFLNIVCSKLQKRE